MDKSTIDSVARIRVLKKVAREAVEGFRNTVAGVGRPLHVPESAETDFYHHDNVKIVEADEAGFTFTLDPTKHQVVVILGGNWVMRHGSSVRRLTVTDTIKVPLDPSTGTTMRSEEPGAKFVYIQFAH